ncbi:MAG: AraC family transcriptional regulator [Bacillota bacterium]|nr:AraC family transcriptional regulator [Bacillota bacterium]
MFLKDINPFIRFAGRFNFSPLESYVSAYDYRLLYAIDGNFGLYIDETYYQSDGGTMFIWKPGIKYKFVSDKPIEIIVLNFDFTQNHSEIVHSLSTDILGSYKPEKITETVDFSDFCDFNSPLIMKNMQLIENDLLKIVYEFSSMTLYFREKASGALKELLVNIARLKASGSVKSAFATDKIIKYIQENYSRNITNSELASLVNYHEYHINRLMMAHTGSTIHQYLLTYRINVAKKLLISTDLSIAEIAAGCGFDEQAYFSNIFKKIVGKSPTDYRKSKSKIV